MADDKATKPHSPLPWHTAARDEDMIIAADKARVADCAIAFGMTALEAEANAKLIVTAVNSYDSQRDTIEALVEAVQFVKAYLAKLEDDGGYYDPLKEARLKFHAPIHAKLDAALALAKENQNG